MKSWLLVIGLEISGDSIISHLMFSVGHYADLVLSHAAVHHYLKQRASVWCGKNLLKTSRNTFSVMKMVVTLVRTLPQYRTWLTDQKNCLMRGSFQKKRWITSGFCWRWSPLTYTGAFAGNGGFPALHTCHEFGCCSQSDAQMGWRLPLSDRSAAFNGWLGHNRKGNQECNQKTEKRTIRQ